MIWMTYGGGALPELDAALRAVESATRRIEAVSARASALDAETAWASPAATAFRSALDLWRRRLVTARPVVSGLAADLWHARTLLQAGGSGAG